MTELLDRIDDAIRQFPQHWAKVPWWVPIVALLCANHLVNRGEIFVPDLVIFMVLCLVYYTWPRRWTLGFILSVGSVLVLARLILMTTRVN